MQDRKTALAAGGSSQECGRQYRQAIAAMGHNEKRLGEQVGLLWENEDMWILLPSTCATVSFRALAFRCLSRLICSVHQLLEVPHTTFPVRMFALLEEPSLAADFVKIPNCMLDAWPRGMRALHPGLDDDVFFRKLALCDMLMAKDTSSIEAKHASIRRILFGASLHKHPQAFDELAAQWAFLQARNKFDDAPPGQASKHKKRQRLFRNMVARNMRHGELQKNAGGMFACLACGL